MDNSINFFLLIRPKHYALYAIDENYQILFKEETFFNDESSGIDYSSLKKFLDKNIFNLEKKLNLYIEDQVYIHLR